MMIPAFFVGLLVGLLLGFWCGTRTDRPRWAVEKTEWAVNGNGEVLVTLTDGTQWRGSCTVWRRFPDGKRAATPLESFLCDVWTAKKWEN